MSPPKQLRKIRLRMGYSVAEFAELLGLLKPTYQGYESGRRPMPATLLKQAQDAEKREKKFFKDLPKRVDKALAGKGVPNEAVRGVF
jgi:transcriptional regulator with XRE-family HTH domain